MQEDVRFAGIARATNQHQEDIRGHGGVPLPVAIGCWKGGVIVQNFHFPIYHVGEEARATRSGRNTRNRVAKAFGEVSAEELFRPIMKQLPPIEEERFVPPLLLIEDEEEGGDFVLPLPPLPLPIEEEEEGAVVAAAASQQT